jgi:transposase-like protein
MFFSKSFENLLELMEAFPTEEACIKHLEEAMWQGQPVSPFDPASTVYRCANYRYKCKNSQKYFTVRNGTIFQGTKIPLKKWFLAIYFATANKKGISSHQLGRYLKISQVSAWFMLHRIRGMMHVNWDESELENTVESDESFFGGKNRNRHWDKKVPQSQGRAFIDKTPVLGLMQRGVGEKKVNGRKKWSILSKIKAIVIPDTQGATLKPLIMKAVKEGANLMTDEWAAYRGLNRFYNHQYVDHGRKQYVNGDCTTNSVEGFWGIAKDVMRTYRKFHRKYLQKYIDECTYRFNSREYSDCCRFNLFLQSGKGKRLTYRQLVNGK